MQSTLARWKNQKLHVYAPELCTYTCNRNEVYLPEQLTVGIIYRCMSTCTIYVVSYMCLIHFVDASTMECPLVRTFTLNAKGHLIPCLILSM